MSLILAKVFGLYFLVIAAAFFLNPDRFKNLYGKIAHDENFLFLGGLLAVLIGAVIISLHNEWVWGWPVIITILGWWSLAKGGALLAFPESIKFFSFIQNQPPMFYRILSLVYFGLGLFLAYKGWR
ncbi:hypothetical protein [Estrella lausannensis]|uniref:Putative membrane protein n=1 Tax=Estrella lausannensis TaxID=483423 RepID=A0A0H5E3T1_9BACT|nr:hypothetical protein [Estrella lausannensis]CRX37875.1 putative membrane protein [Estrella lausannensis]